MTNKLHTTRWAFDLSTWSPTLSQLTHAVATVQSEERSRLMKFYFIDDFLSSLVGRLLMRKYVSYICDLPYADIIFERDSRGKPYWKRNVMPDNCNLPTLSFNVSHQGNFVILAGAMNNSMPDFHDFGVGCDVMKLEYSGGKDVSEFFHIMNKKFSDNEWSFIKQSHFNELQQVKAFMRHWCLKESYVKEVGVGITVDLQKIVFSVDNSRDLTFQSRPLCGTTLSCNDVPMNQYYFEEHMIHPQYCAAIAFRNIKPNVVERFKFLDIIEILKPNVAKNDKEIVDYCRNVLNKPRK